MPTGTECASSYYATGWSKGFWGEAEATVLRSARYETLVVVFLLFGGTAKADPITVFSSNFDSGAPAEISGYYKIESVQGYDGIGTGSNVFSGNLLWNDSGGTTEHPGSISSQQTVLTLTGLPEHSSINLSFLLAIIDSWDADNHPSAGPDYFNISIDGNLLFRATFSNLTFDASQDYVPPPGGLLVTRSSDTSEFPELGFGGHRESAYDMGLDPFFQNIPHTGGTLTVSWWADGAGWQGGLDESWGLDNLRVAVNVPETGSLVFLALGFLSVVGAWASKGD